MDDELYRKFARASSTNDAVVEEHGSLLPVMEQLGFDITAVAEFCTQRALRMLLIRKNQQERLRRMMRDRRPLNVLLSKDEIQEVACYAALLMDGMATAFRYVNNEHEIVS